MLLGLLADGPASGYELTRRFERALQRYAWHARHSQIYPELNRLAGAGLIAVVAEGARGRRTYAITDAGRADLRDWLTHPPAAYDVRNEFVLTLFFVSTLHADEARALLRSIADESARELAVLGEASRSRTPRSRLFRSPCRAAWRPSTACHHSRPCTTGHCGRWSASSAPSRAVEGILKGAGRTLNPFP